MFCNRIKPISDDLLGNGKIKVDWAEMQRALRNYIKNTQKSQALEMLFPSLPLENLA